ncbi:MAG: Flp pilus assembly protein TadD [Pirellulaceae bacterium]|jgi:Flp pilus assembly protein TadD
MTVSTRERTRRMQIMQEVEGYLDLLLVFCDQYVLDQKVTRRLANRALKTLHQLSSEEIQQRSQALFLEGQCHRCLEEYHRAAESFRAATDLEPENVHIWLALGWCHKRNQRLDLAIEALEEALHADPNEAIIHYNLACYWSLANNVRTAVQYLAQSFEIDPNYRELVLDERDFDPIRNTLEFQTLTSVMI